MKILLTTPSFPPIIGGLGNAVYQQALSLTYRGFDVTVATSVVAGNPRNNSSNKIKVVEFSIDGADWVGNPIRGEIGEYIRFLRETDFDLIIMHAWQNWATDIILNNSANIKGLKILHSHCLSVNEFYSNQPFRSMLRYLAWRPYLFGIRDKLNLLDGIFFLANTDNESRFLDLEISKETNIPKYFIPNSLSDPTYNVLNISPVPMDQRNQLISVGSYQWQKGFDFVMRAYSISNFKNIKKLILFGQKFTDYTDKLRKESLHLGIKSDYIEFYERVTGEHLIKEYLKSLLFLSGSVTECQPMVLLDASATGTPFIARQTGCIKEMMGGRSVVSPENMAEKINYLISHCDEWSKLSAAGRSEASRLYSPDVVAEKLVNSIYEIATIAKQRRRRS